MPWLLLEAGTAACAVVLWRGLLHVKRNARRLVQEGKLEGLDHGPAAVRSILRDLRGLEVRLREMGLRAENEDFSLRAILSSMVEGVMILDREYRIRLINVRLQAMFLLPRSPQGRTVLEVFRNHLLHELIRRTLQGGSPQFEELQVELREGESFTTRHFQVTSVSLQPNRAEELAGVLVVFHDITQIRALEGVRQEFVANVSHELRTPLSILSGYLETLLDEEVDPATAKRFVATMHRHAQRLNALVEDLLLLSRLESRRLPLHPETVSARELFARVLERFESLFAAADATVDVHAPEDLSFTADAFWLEQALFNLIDNALKYGGGAGKLHLALSACLEGAEAVLRVADDGPGIPLRDQPHVFERFYRVHKDRSRDAGGTGLGLSIVKHTVQAQGGTVALDSSPGKGATFTLRFPRGQGQEVSNDN